MRSVSYKEARLEHFKVPSAEKALAMAEALGVTVEINGSEREATAYLAAAFEQRPEYRSGLSRLVVRLDGDWAELEYILRTPFERIRRITGYLVGTTDRWNNAKIAEEHDRVKHNYD